MPERTGSTFVGTVAFIDIVEYSKKPVSEQLQVKERFNSHIAEAIHDIPPRERIILDTGDGAAISFLGDPEDALFVAMNLAQCFARPADGGAVIEVRVGVNLGPVRLVRDINGQPNIIGDGINVAQRVMSFARPGQVLVSRAYHEVVTRISQDYAQLFAYQGSRTDKHVREHEIYEVAVPFDQARDLAQRRHSARPSKPTETGAPRPATSWHRNSVLAWGFLGASAGVLAIAAFVSFGTLPREASLAAKPSVHTTAPAPTPSEHVTAPPPAPEVEAVAATGGPEAASAPALEHTGSSKLDRAPGKRPESPRRPGSDARGSTPAAGPEPVQLAATAPSNPSRPVEPALIKPGARLESAPDAPVTKPAASAQSRAARGPSALVVLAVSPWGEVYVDGKSAGVSPPMSELELTPGKHRIEIRNGGFRPYEAELDLGPNETLRLKHKFVQGR
jgi:class 3 adenylate cyclase